MNIFKVENNSIEYSYILYNVINIYTHLFNFDKIRNIFISRIFNEDFEDVKNEDMSANAFDEKNLKEIFSNNSKTHLDSNLDIIYISLLKRISKLF